MVLGMLDSFQLALCFSSRSIVAWPDRHRRMRSYNIAFNFSLLPGCTRHCTESRLDGCYIARLGPDGSSGGPLAHAARLENIAAFCRSESFGEDWNRLPKSTANGSGKMSSCPASMPSRIANATSREEAFGIASSRDMSVSTGPG